MPTVRDLATAINTIEHSNLNTDLPHVSFSYNKIDFYIENDIYDNNVTILSAKIAKIPNSRSALLAKVFSILKDNASGKDPTMFCSISPKTQYFVLQSFFRLDDNQYNINNIVHAFIKTSEFYKEIISK